MPRAVAHIRSPSLGALAGANNIFGMFLDEFLWFCPPACDYEKKAVALHGCVAVKKM